MPTGVLVISSGSASSLVVVVELGRTTPPLGISLIVVDSIAKAGIAPVIRGVIPHFYIFGLFLLLLLIFP